MLDNAGLSITQIARKVNLPTLTVQTILQSCPKNDPGPVQGLDDDRNGKQGLLVHKAITLVTKKSEPLEPRLLLAKSMYEDILDGQRISAVAKKHGLHHQKAMPYLELIGIGELELKLIARVLKSQEILNLKQLRKNGLTRLQMARVSNKPPELISTYLNIPEKSIPYTDAKSLTKIKKTLEFRVLYAAGMSFLDIAGHCGVSVSTIILYLSDAGLKELPAGSYRIKQRRRICQLAKEQWEASKTIKEIASNLGLASPTVIRYLKTVGIDTKVVYQERRQKVKADILAGKPVTLSAASVYRYLKDHGLHGVRQQKRKEAIGQCKALWDIGKGCKEIAAQMILGINTVRRYLKEAGVDLHATRKQKEEAIKSALQEGKSITEVARTFSSSYERVCKLIDMNDLKKQKQQIRAQRAVAFHLLFKKGLNLKEIAAARETSPTMVRIHLLEIGVDPSAAQKAKKKKILKALRAGKPIQDLVRKGMATYATIHRYKMELDKKK